MTKKFIFNVIVFITITSIVILVFLYFILNYKIHESYLSNKNNNALFFLINREAAKKISLIVSNSRIFQSYLIYESTKYAFTPVPVWRDNIVEIPNVNNGGQVPSSISQGKGVGTFRIIGFPVNWSDQVSLITVRTNKNKEMVFAVDNSTLIYEQNEAIEKSRFIGRGKPFMPSVFKGKNLSIIIYDNGGIPIILEILILPI